MKKPANATIAFRLPEDLREFYERRAEKERRKLSDMLRIALEDQAKAQGHDFNRAKAA
jgi:hypothetical protein